MFDPNLVPDNSTQTLAVFDLNSIISKQHSTYAMFLPGSNSSSFEIQRNFDTSGEMTTETLV